MNKIIQILG
jgi:hypothetical protein